MDAVLKIAYLLEKEMAASRHQARLGLAWPDRLVTASFGAGPVVVRFWLLGVRVSAPWKRGPLSFSAVTQPKGAAVRLGHRSF